MSTEELRTQPNDKITEKMVLGAMMLSPSGAATALSMLVGSDFYHPAHTTIFDTIAALAENREPTELGAVHARLLNNGTLAKVGGAAYLLELSQQGATASQVAYYASQLAELAMRRAAITAGTQFVQRAWNADGSTADEVITWALERIAAVRAGTGEALANEGLSAADLMAEPPAYQWVIPHMLERGDRLMLTGAEGAGKSMLTRQIAVCAAAGLHPFTHRPCEPQRVLVVDCENSMTMSMRRYRPLFDAARAAGSPVTDTFRFYSEPSGVDLTSRGGGGQLIRWVERHRPDLLVIGPLYRMHASDPNDERDARRVALALDRVRDVSGAAVVIEAHAPHKGPNVKHRALRPVGSSLWMRWPEFGLGLESSEDEVERRFRVSKLVPWRGSRDERKWPNQIRSGRPWPWVIDEAS